MSGNVIVLMMKRMERILKARATYLTVMYRDAHLRREHKVDRITDGHAGHVTLIDAFNIPLAMALVIVWRVHLHGMSKCRPSPRQRRQESLLTRP